jgi:hypothetical protein
LIVINIYFKVMNDDSQSFRQYNEETLEGDDYFVMQMESGSKNLTNKEKE